MGSKDDLQQFLRANPDAWRFADKACDDYLLARLGMLAAMWSSFEMATQAVEKLLKAYLLFADPLLGGNADAVRRAVMDHALASGRRQERGHDVKACLALAKQAGLRASGSLEVRIDSINEYYWRRYPDGGGPTNLSTKELADVDEAVFEVWDSFEGLHPDYFFVGGLMRDVYGMLLDERSARAIHRLREFSVLTTANRSFDARRPALETGVRARIATWYPP